MRSLQEEGSQGSSPEGSTSGFRGDWVCALEGRGTGFIQTIISAVPAGAEIVLRGRFQGCRKRRATPGYPAMSLGDKIRTVRNEVELVVGNMQLAELKSSSQCPPAAGTRDLLFTAYGLIPAISLVGANQPGAQKGRSAESCLYDSAACNPRQKLQTR